MESLLHNFISSLASVPQEDFFDRLVQKIDDHFDSVTFNSMSNMKKYNKSLQKGILFEIICYKLLKANGFSFQKINIKDVWFTSNIVKSHSSYSLNGNSSNNLPHYNTLSEENRLAFALGKKDMGIDLVAQTTDNQWIAIQCKYRRKPKRSRAPNGKKIYWSVTWKDLSTFYSLCQRTGPYNNSGNYSSWLKHAVMTNAPSVNRQGRKNDKDLSICIGSFRNIPKNVWLAIIGYKGYNLNGPNISYLIPNSSMNNRINNLNLSPNDRNKTLSKEELRQKRLSYFSKI